MDRRKTWRRGAWIAAALACFLLRAAAAASQRMADGMVLDLPDGSVLKLEVEAADIIRVVSARDPAFLSHSSLMRVPGEKAAVPWTWAAAGGEGVLSTPRLQARVNLNSGRVTFTDPAGRVLLAEKPGGRALVPATVQGEPAFHVRQQWLPPAGEALYGLGQQQLDLLDLRGRDLDLWQHNGTAIVPFLVSSGGYGILWDNASFTRFGDLAEPQPIAADQLLDAAGRPGALTGSYFSDGHFGALAATRRDGDIAFLPAPGNRHPNGRLHPALPRDGEVSIRWEGSVRAAATGDYAFQAFSNCGLRLWIDGALVMDHWRQGWLPWIDLARLHFAAGETHRLRLEWTVNQGDPVLTLRWKPPVDRSATSLWSEVGQGIDYYFVYGPGLDAVVAGYRRLTGPAPLMPRWAFGLWQSRQRYKTAQEGLDVAAGFRSRGIPFDTLVQDWMYWKEDEWGSHRFDPQRFPDPAGWIRRLHDDYHAHVVISVWGKFYPGTDNFAAMQRGGFLYRRNLDEGTVDWLGHRYTFYDAFNPAGRRLFWSQVDRDLFRLGVDGWWLDATEPDLRPTPTLDGQRDYVNPTALGPGARVLNAYSLLQSQGIYEGQRAGRSRPARLHPHPLGLRGPAALRGRDLVGRHHLDLDRAAQAGDGRAGIRALGHPLLDDGLGRILGAPALFEPPSRGGGRRGMARAQHPLVRVRGVLPALAGARGMAQPGDVGIRGRDEPGLRGAAQGGSAALPAAALSLFARGRGHGGGRDDVPPAGDGFSAGPRGARHQGPVPPGARPARESGRDLSGPEPPGLSPRRGALV